MNAILVALVFILFYIPLYKYYRSNGFSRDLLVFTLLYILCMGLVIAETLGLHLPDIAWISGKAVVEAVGIKVE